jgi:hypothetical protein
MPDPFPVPRGPAAVGLALAGAISTALYLSGLLLFAYLVPVQYVFGRYGWRGGLASAAVSAGGIAVAGALALKGAQSGISALGALVVAPAVCLGALALMNAAFWDSRHFIFRILAATAALSIAASPLIVRMAGDPAVSEYLQKGLSSFLAPLSAQIGAAIESGSYEATALIAALDPKAIAGKAIATLTSSFAAFIFLLLGGSWWLGNRTAGAGSRGRRLAPALAAYRLPPVFVWPFLAAWAFVLASLVLRTEAPAFFAALAWNSALVLSLAFAGQGAGIVSHLIEKWNLPKPLRIAIVATFIATLFTPRANAAVGIFLPVLGVTEIWIPYRNPKGVGA